MGYEIGERRVDEKQMIYDTLEELFVFSPSDSWIISIDETI